MGLFSKKNKGEENVIGGDGVPGSALTATDSPESKPAKKSFYQKWSDLKRGPGTAGLSDEEFERATGMSRDEMAKWSVNTPGVAGGQAAGSLTAGGNSGLGTATGAGEGLGGWGYEAGRAPKER